MKELPAKGPSGVVGDHLAAFARSAGIQPDPRTGRRIRIGIPTTFSLARAPEESLRAIHALVSAALARPAVLTLDFESARSVDLCAASVLFALAAEAHSPRRRVQVKLPASERLRSRLAASGLGRIDPAAASGDVLLPLDRLVRLEAWSEKQLHRRASDHANRVMERLENWAYVNGRRILTDEFRERVGQAVGEAVTNAAQHSRSDWWMAGHVEQGSRNIPRVHLVIFNFGDSMSQSWARLPDASPTQKVLGDFIAAHADAFDRDWTKENLLDLLAVQERMSRFGDEVERGVGTLRIIELFEYLFVSSKHAPRARMAWLSGRTHIVFDGRYFLRQSRIESREGTHDLAFNHANDLCAPPDPTAVRNLPLSFPGTLLTLDFDLRQQYFTKAKVGDELDIDAPHGGPGPARWPSVQTLGRRRIRD